MGVMAFVMHLLMTPEQLAALPPAEQALYQDIPLWSTLAFACAVIAGLGGAVLLALRRAIAFPVLVVSLLGVLVQQYYNFFVIDSLSVLGTSAVIMPLVVIFFAVMMLLVSQSGKKRGWII